MAFEVVFLQSSPYSVFASFPVRSVESWTEICVGSADGTETGADGPGRLLISFAAPEAVTLSPRTICCAADDSARSLRSSCPQLPRYGSALPVNEDGPHGSSIRETNYFHNIMSLNVR